MLISSFRLLDTWWLIIYKSTSLHFVKVFFINVSSSFIWGDMIKSEKMDIRQIESMVQSYASTGRGLHFLLKDQGNMIPDPMEQGYLRFPNVVSTTLALHDIDNANCLTIGKKNQGFHTWTLGSVIWQALRT